MKLKPSGFLAFNAGYVDTFGFLSLHGLFTAHVTGNFVTIGAAMAMGSTGIVTKLMALPVFCAVVILVRLSIHWMAARSMTDLKVLLWIKVLLLVLSAVFALGLGPFPDGDTWPSMLTGMTMVAAMAIQNAVHRTHMTSEAPSTLMTGSTTQILIDVVDIVQGTTQPNRAVVVARFVRLITSVLAFAIGCAIAALGYALVGMWAFILPPVVGLLALLNFERPSRVS